MENEFDICQYEELKNEDDILIDVRDSIVFSHGFLDKAINIPIDEIAKLYSLPFGHKIYVYCQSGEVSKQIVDLLVDAGYDAYHLSGGYRKYLKHIINQS